MDYPAPHDATHVDDVGIYYKYVLEVDLWYVWMLSDWREYPPYSNPKGVRPLPSRMDIIGQNGNTGEHYDMVTSDGSTASYYELPSNATELQHLISHRNMNAQMGEIFRACYRYGQASHSDKLRDAKKIKFYIEAELERLEKYE